MIDFWVFPLSTIWGAYQNQGFPRNREAFFLLLENRCRVFGKWGGCRREVRENFMKS